MARVSRGLDRVEVSFDDPNLVANAGLILVSTLALRLDLEALINATVRLVGKVGGALPGRKVLTLVHSIVAGQAAPMGSRRPEPSIYGPVQLGLRSRFPGCGLGAGEGEPGGTNCWCGWGEASLHRIRRASAGPAAR